VFRCRFDLYLVQALTPVLSARSRQWRKHDVSTIIGLPIARSKSMQWRCAERAVFRFNALRRLKVKPLSVRSNCGANRDVKCC
jgi:hypothetical protein